MSAGEQQHWLANATTGSVSAEFDVLKLAGDINMQRHSSGQAPVVITTDQLTIDTNTRQIQTDSTVTIEAPEWNFSGNGLHADADKGTLKIPAGVEAQYYVPE